jgi:hypothetical protein
MMKRESFGTHLLIHPFVPEISIERTGRKMLKLDYCGRHVKSSCSTRSTVLPSRTITSVSGEGRVETHLLLIHVVVREILVRLLPRTSFRHSQSKCSAQSTRLPSRTITSTSGQEMTGMPPLSISSS